MNKSKTLGIILLPRSIIHEDFVDKLEDYGDGILSSLDLSRPVRFRDELFKYWEFYPTFCNDFLSNITVAKDGRADYKTCEEDYLVFLLEFPNKINNLKLIIQGEE